MRRTPLKTTYTPLERTPIKPRSTKKRKTDDELTVARRNVLARDHYTCRLLTAQGVVCGGGFHVHHIKFRSRASAATMHDEANLTVLCDVHHEWVHAHDDYAHALGLSLHAEEPYAEAWARLHAHGLAERPEPSGPRRATSPYTGSEDDRCQFCSRRGFIDTCPTCNEETRADR